MFKACWDGVLCWGNMVIASLLNWFVVNPINLASASTFALCCLFIRIPSLHSVLFSLAAAAFCGLDVTYHHHIIIALDGCVFVFHRHADKVDRLQQRKFLPFPVHHIHATKYTIYSYACVLVAYINTYIRCVPRASSAHFSNYRNLHKSPNGQKVQWLPHSTHTQYEK